MRFIPKSFLKRYEDKSNTKFITKNATYQFDHGAVYKDGNLVSNQTLVGAIDSKYILMNNGALTIDPNKQIKRDELEFRVGDHLLLEYTSGRKQGNSKLTPRIERIK